MSKFRQGYSRKQSPLFDGDTIFKQLNSSSFGRFQAAMQSVQSYLPASHFQLPKVIVIGGKSAGKSSLLPLTIFTAMLLSKLGIVASMTQRTRVSSSCR